MRSSSKVRVPRHPGADIASHFELAPRSPASRRHPERESATGAARSTSLGIVLALYGLAPMLLGTGSILLGQAPELAPPQVADRIADHVADRIDVRVLEINVVVSDRHGIPITDVAREEFRLLVEDRPVAIEYFSNVQNGVDITAGQAAAEGDEDAAVTPAAPVAPVLAILWDAGSLGPQEGKQVLEGLAAEIDALSAATRGIMVAEYSDRLSIVQPLTRSADLVKAALGSLTGDIRVATAQAEQRALFRQIELATSAGGAEQQGGFSSLGSSDADVAAAEAQSIFDQIVAQAGRDRRDFSRRMVGLAELVDSLGAIEGRKELLFLGAGLELQPGGLELRLFEEKYGEAFPLLLSQLQGETFSSESVTELRQLTAQAARQQVVFHTVNAGRPRSTGRSAESRTFQVDAVLSDQGIRQGEFLSTLASATGGEASLGNAKPKILLDRVRAGLTNYYTLGFTVPDEAPKAMKIRVDVTRPKVQLRYWRNISRDVEMSLERVARGALIATTLDNPLRARIDAVETTPVSKEQRQGRSDLKGASAVVSFLVRVPVAELVLLPEGNQHLARLTFAVIARGPRGAASTPIRRDVPFEIGNDRLLQAMTQDVAIPVQVAIGEGDHEVVIVVQDTVGERASTLRFTSAPINAQGR